MNCPNCGKEVQGRFCTNCGAQMPEAAAPESSQGMQGMAAPESGGRQPYVSPFQAGGTGDPGATSVIRPGDLPDAAEQQPYGTVGRAEPPPPDSNWARELGVGQTSSVEAKPPAPSVATASSNPGLRYPSRFTAPAPVQEWLKPLEALGKQYVAWIGSALLLIGLFISAKTYSVSIGIYSASASRSLWDYGTFWAIILLLLVVASAGLAFVRDYKWLLITGVASLVILILNFLYAFSGEGGVSAHPSWAWILLFPGALLIIAAGAMRTTARDAQNDQGLDSVIASLRNMTGGR